MDRRVLLISNHNADRSFWNGVCYDFLNVVGSIENARLVAPEATYSLQQAFRSLTARRGSVLSRDNLSVRKRLIGLSRGWSPKVTEIDDDFDLCFYMFYMPGEVRLVERVRNWRKRSGLAVAFMLEGWSGLLPSEAKSLAQLDAFDHVFVLNADAIPTLRRYTSTPITFLPTGVDCRRACPRQVEGPGAPERSVDVLSLGRKLPRVHERMLEIAERRDLFYHYDIWEGMRASDWELCRRFNADLTCRSRYSVVWDPTIEAPFWRKTWMADDHPLTNRFFEATAGGAVVLGSRSASPVFDDLFDWPDAVVPIAPDGSDLDGVLAELDGDPLRTGLIRRRNVTNALRRHDWAYRWSTVLEVVGLRPTAGHAARLRDLSHRADAIDLAAPRPSLVPALSLC